MRLSRIVRAAGLAFGGLALAGCAAPGAGDPPAAAVEPMSAQGMLQVERHLVRLGYLAGGDDGAITAETRAAIRAFQGDIGVAATGEVSEALLAALLAQPGLAAPAPVVPVQAAAPVEPVAPRPAPRGNSGGGGGGGGGQSWD